MAASRPIFTHEACRLGIVRPSASRNTAVCLRFSSREISSTPCVRPSSVWNGMKRQRHELGDAAGALLQLADHAHVLGELPGLLDVAEHHGRRRPQPRAVRGLDDLDPARHRQLVRARCARAPRRGGPRPRCPASTPARRRAAGRRPRPATARRCRTCARPPSASRRAGAGRRRRGSLRHAQPAPVVLERPSRGGCRTGCTARSRRSRRPRGRGDGTPPRSARRRPASACPGRSRRTRSRRCRRSRR